MNEFSNGPVAAKHTRGNNMELLIPIGVLAVWFILQAWVLPRLGVPT
jgi:hypothetical protein